MKRKMIFIIAIFVFIVVGLLNSCRHKDKIVINVYAEDEIELLVEKYAKRYEKTFDKYKVEVNKLDNFKIEIEKQELTKIQNNQFSDCTAVGDFDFGALKGITKFKVAKFEKVLQLLNFPKVIEVVNRVQYVFNEKTKEYELKFYKLKEE